jgi:hypothetical protein
VDASLWQACQEPQELLEWLRDSGRADERRLRLFAAACVRRIWGLMSDQRSRQAVEVAEKFADCLASPEELQTVAESAAGVAWGNSRNAAVFVYAGDPLVAAGLSVYFVACAMASQDESPVTASEARSAARKLLAQVLRDIYSPFDAVRPNPSLLTWNGGLVARLAQAAYDLRMLPEGTLDPARLAVLCDAVEEAGLAAPELLSHLRGGPHYRGRHAIDALLGRS